MYAHIVSILSSASLMLLNTYPVEMIFKKALYIHEGSLISLANGKNCSLLQLKL